MSCTLKYYATAQLAFHGYQWGQDGNGASTGTSYGPAYVGDSSSHSGTAIYTLNGGKDVNGNTRQDMASGGSGVGVNKVTTSIFNPASWMPYASKKEMKDHRINDYYYDIVSDISINRRTTFPLTQSINAVDTSETKTTTFLLTNTGSTTATINSLQFVVRYPSSTSSSTVSENQDRLFSALYFDPAITLAPGATSDPITIRNTFGISNPSVTYTALPATGFSYNFSGVSESCSLLCDSVTKYTGIAVNQLFHVNNITWTNVNDLVWVHCGNGLDGQGWYHNGVPAENTYFTSDDGGTTFNFVSGYSYYDITNGGWTLHSTTNCPRNTYTEYKTTILPHKVNTSSTSVDSTHTYLVGVERPLLGGWNSIAGTANTKVWVQAAPDHLNTVEFSTSTSGTISGNEYPTTLNADTVCIYVPSGYGSRRYYRAKLAYAIRTDSVPSTFPDFYIPINTLGEQTYYKDGDTYKKDIYWNHDGITGYLMNSPGQVYYSCAIST